MYSEGNIPSKPWRNKPPTVNGSTLRNKYIRLPEKAQCTGGSIWGYGILSIRWIGRIAQIVEVDNEN